MRAEGWTIIQLCDSSSLWGVLEHSVTSAERGWLAMRLLSFSSALWNGWNLLVRWIDAYCSESEQKPPWKASSAPGRSPFKGFILMKFLYLGCKFAWDVNLPTQHKCPFFSGKGEEYPWNFPPPSKSKSITILLKATVLRRMFSSVTFCTVVCVSSLPQRHSSLCLRFLAVRLTLDRLHFCLPRLLRAGFTILSQFLIFNLVEWLSNRILDFLKTICLFSTDLLSTSYILHASRFQKYITGCLLRKFQDFG